MQKDFRTKSQMYPIVEGFSSSGTTHKAYCKSLGLKYGTYKYWCRKYKLEKEISTKNKEKTTSSFIDLQFSAESVVCDSIEIVYPNGVRLQLSIPLDATRVATLSKLLSCLD